MHLRNAAVIFFLCLFSVACTGPGGKTFGAKRTWVNGPPMGDYVCSQVIMYWDGTWRSEQKGLLKLVSEDTYQYQEGGNKESYTYDEANKKLKFTSGFFQDATGTFIPRDKVWQIDVDFATKSPMTWNCAQNKH